MPFHNETRAHYRRIRSILRLPGPVAQNGDRRSGGLIVPGRKQAAAERLHAKRGEIVARYVLRSQRFSDVASTFLPDAQTLTARLKCRHFVEFRRLRFKPFVERQGVHPPSILRTALHTAIDGGCTPCR